MIFKVTKLYKKLILWHEREEPLFVEGIVWEQVYNNLPDYAEWEWEIEEIKVLSINNMVKRMETSDEIKPNHAPAFYPVLAAICHRHGYSLAVHGSLIGDFDLIAVPWADNVSNPDIVLADILQEFGGDLIGELTPKKHGRLCQTVSVGFGYCAIDLSFMSITERTYP